MKSGVAAGAVAGLVSGIVSIVLGVVGSSMGLFALAPLPVEYGVSISIVSSMIFGAVFGALYSRLHDPIPGKGISKGLYFGLMIWLMKDIAAGASVPLLSKHLDWTISVGLIFIGFFEWIVYGSLLGALYKKQSLTATEEAPERVVKNKGA